jgi:putative aldouronate transport system permease protein
MAGEVRLWPIGFTTRPYEYLLKRELFWNAFFVSTERLVIGSAINIFLAVLLAYPLSKKNSKFRGRTVYVWFFFLTLLVGGGLIPTYMLVARLGMLDTVTALVLPCAVPVFNIILMLNFFRQIPRELEEAAFMDGAGHFRTLFQIFVPVSLPSIVTIALFSMVGHWNAWFDGIIYMNRPGNYPLQSYLRGVVISLDMSKINSSSWTDYKDLSGRTVKCTQIIIATIPILLVYSLRRGCCRGSKTIAAKRSRPWFWAWRTKWGNGSACWRFPCATSPIS